MVAAEPFDVCSMQSKLVLLCCCTHKLHVFLLVSLQSFANLVLSQPLDSNLWYCMKCQDGGDLLCCDGCPASYHPACLGILPPNSDGREWFCEACLKVRTLKDLEGLANTQQAPNQYTARHANACPCLPSPSPPRAVCVQCCVLPCVLPCIPVGHV